MVLPLILVTAIVGVATVWAVTLAIGPSGRRWKSSANAVAPLGILLPSVVITSIHMNRGITDRSVYMRDFRSVASSDVGEALMESDREPLFVLFLKSAAMLGTSEFVLYGLVSLLCSSVYVAALSRIIGWQYVPIAFVASIGFGFLLDYTSVAIRQGFALVLVFSAVVALLLRKMGLALTLVAAASLFHWSAIAVGVVALLVALIRSLSLQMLLTGWVASAVIFVVGGFAGLGARLAVVVPEVGTYTDPELSAVYSGGVFRLDFLAFSAALLAIFLFLFRFGSMPEWFTDAVRYYIAFNILFLLLGGLFFSDRIAVYSWFLAPLLLTAPIIGREADRKGRAAAAVAITAMLIVGVVQGSFASLATTVSSVV